MIEYDLEYDERDVTIAKALCYLIFFFSLVLIFLTYMRYLGKLDWYKRKREYGSKETLYTTGLWKNTLLEATLNMIFPTPWTIHIRVYFVNRVLDIPEKTLYYHVNEILILILMIRCILLFRSLLLLTRWVNNRSSRVCKMYSCESNYLFSIKCIMREEPY